jgi:hypothetical protein
MMNNRKVILTFAWSVAILIPAVLIFAQGSSYPNGAPFKIDDVHQTFVAPPDYSAAFTGTGNRSMTLGDRWLKIETAFDSAPRWADDVQLKYYVLLGDGRDQRMFVGDVTYVNVAKGERHYSAMFIHPNILQRYGNGQVQAIAVVLSYKGQPIDVSTDPPANERWWEHYPPTTGFLLNPQQTPWSVMSFGRYEELKPTP